MPETSRVQHGHNRLCHNVAQTKDLRWSRLNPTLYSLRFAGKAKRHVTYASCLSDNHSTEQCPENLEYNGARLSSSIDSRGENGLETAAHSVTLCVLTTPYFTYGNFEKMYHCIL